MERSYLSDEQAEEMMRKVINRYLPFVKDELNPVQSMAHRFYLGGGDSTYLLIVHYGSREKLEDAIRSIMTQDNEKEKTMTKIDIALSDVCRAFDSHNVGSKVLDGAIFYEEMTTAIRAHTFAENGQAVLPLSKKAAIVTGAGVAKRKGLTTSDYVIREWRGEMMLFAKRVYAVDTESVSVVVYTRDAYLNDPQVDEEERERIRLQGVTHVLVAVLASAGPRPPVSSTRFVRNLAGGNNAYKPENGYTLERAIEEAKAVAAYEEEWVTVSD